jgi:hypothetical protein
MFFLCCSVPLNLSDTLFPLPPLSKVAATRAAAARFLFAAANSPVPAAKWRNGRSGGIIACCRRIPANTVAAPVLAAVFCGAKFAIQRLLPCLPPRISATKWRKFANLAIFV